MIQRCNSGGALCLADRTDAAGLSPTDLDGKSLNTETITAEIDSVESDGSDSPLNTYRSEARRAVRETAQAEMRAGGFGVGTITLPTGLGKDVHRRRNSTHNPRHETR